MKIVAKILRIFSYAWYGVVGLVCFAAVALDFYRHGFWEALWSLLAALNPFNFMSYFVLFIFFLPGLLASFLANQIEQRAKKGALCLNSTV